MSRDKAGRNMAEHSLPWDRRPGYLAAIAAEVLPGGLTAYRVPRPVGNSPADVTGFMPGQAEWAVNNYSDILYQLYPTKEWHDFKKSGRPSQMIDEDGNPMVEPFPHPSSTPRPLLDFPILPLIIGTAESASYFETVRRWDPRIRWEDLTMRMPLSERPPSNTLQMRVARFLRDNHSLIAWHDTTNRTKPNASRTRVLRGLTDAQKRANTTRGSTPGLIDPRLGVEGGVVPYPVLGRGRGQNRRLRKDWANKAASAQVDEPRNRYHRTRKDQARHATLVEEELKDTKEEELFDGTPDLKHKRKASDEPVESTAHEQAGGPRKKLKQGSSWVDEEAKTPSEIYGIPLDPALFADTQIGPKNPHYDQPRKGNGAGGILSAGYQVPEKRRAGDKGIPQRVETLNWDDWLNLS